jgi:hypothetical protein
MVFETLTSHPPLFCSEEHCVSGTEHVSLNAVAELASLPKPMNPSWV